MGMQNHKPHSNIQVAFNLFAFLNGENVYAIGGVKHEIYADDETARRLLPKTVPIDALSAIREKVLAGEEMVSLEDGTPAIPGEIFRVLHHAGKAHLLFESLLQTLGAPEEPLFCLTLVRDGVPINDDGPIYEGGTLESDRELRREYFINRNLLSLGELNLEMFARKGPGAILITASPKPADFEHRDIVYVSETDCNRPAPVWAAVRRNLAEYNPATQMVLVLDETDADYIYHVLMPGSSFMSAIQATEMVFALDEIDADYIYSVLGPGNSVRSSIPSSPGPPPFPKFCK